MEGVQGQKSGLTHLTPHEEPRKSGAVSVYGILSAKDRFRILRFLLVTTLSWISQRGPSGPNTHSAKVTETARRPTASGGRVWWHEKRILSQHGAPREHYRLNKLQN